MDEQTLPPAKKLTAREKRFVEEIPKHRYRADAARVAGFSQKWARNSAVNLMALPHVRAAVETQAAELTRAAEMENVEIIRGLSAIARAGPDDFEVVEGELRLKVDRDPVLWLAVESVEMKYDSDSKTFAPRFKLRDSIKARALLMKHFGMLRDIVQLTTPIPIQIYIPDNGRDSNTG